MRNVHAQEFGTGLEEIVVTARKRKESLLEVPSSITVVEGTWLEDRGIKKFDDVARLIPNFSFFSDIASRSIISVRGIGFSNSYNLAPGTGLYVDGVYQTSTAAFNIPIFDIEKLEVLKGPQGTIYGRNSFAGAVVITTRAPDAQPRATVRGEVSRFGTYETAASLSGPLSEDKLSGRLSAAYRTSDGPYKYRATGNDVSKLTYRTARGSLRWTATDALTVDLLGSYYSSEGGSRDWSTVETITDTRKNFLFDEPNPESVDFHNVALRATWEAENYGVVSVTSYDHRVDHLFQDADFTATPQLRVDDRMKKHIFAQELRLHSIGAAPLTWLAGVYFSSEGDSSNRVQSGSRLAATGPVRTYGETSANSVAGFFDATYAFMPQWKLGFGLRYDSIRRDAAQQVSLAGGPESIVLSDVKIDPRTFDGLQPRVSLTYLTHDETSLYATLARGFREGGFNANAVGTVAERFDSDTLWSYEIGAKTFLWDHRARLNASAFYVEADNLNSPGLVVDPIRGALLVTVSTGSIKSYGLELDGTMKMTDELTVSAAAGWNETKYTEVRPTALPGTAVGQPQFMAPLWTASLTADWTHPILDGAYDLVFGATFSGVGKTRINFSPTMLPEKEMREPVYQVDVSASLEQQSWKLQFFVKNLFDEIYPRQFLDQALISAFGATNDVSLLSPPRWYGIRAEYSF